VSVHECWSVCERREWEEKRLAHRELNSLLIQRTAFRTSPAHTTNHNTSDILLSCVRVTHTHASKQSALPGTEMPSSEKSYHCFQCLRTQSKGRLFKSISFSAKPASCGFALVTVTDCSDDLAVSRRPRQPHRCSGFPLTCFLASNLNQGEGARNSDEPLMAPLLSFPLLARFIPVRHFKVPGFNLKNVTQIMSTIHFMSSTFKDIDIFKLISIRSTLQNRAVFVH